ncbi:cupin domain-containing protein [Altererythrobacter salegens]|uniref:Cupin domain-containing protein n=1 Tax=Croceibacterium salegens TaxID=1737568 RepID=A0A6I4T2V9_9SPHN|nr:cupin domain-containing protein [Croceibacterium salegens]MXO60992.1 cupin domain-containing protein [Croceibacterium salegens]
MSETPVRRIVTGHDEQGRAVFLEDGPPPRVVRVGGEIGPLFHEVWNTRETPAIIDRASGEPAEEGIQLAPPKNGTRIRVLDIPPEDERLAALSVEQVKSHFAEVGAGNASSHSDDGSSRHHMMHRTETIDYGIVLEGEVTLILDIGETVVKAGDIVIQRGTNHGWANRSGRNCRIAFILIDGEFTEGLDA